MALDGAVHHDGQYLALLPATTITAAVSGVAGTVFGSAPSTSGQFLSLAGARYLVVQCVFTYGSGGTTANLYVQTSLDWGVTWVDVMNFSFTTASATKISAITTNIAPATQAFSPTDGSLTANTIVQGVLGAQFRTKLTTTGTYAGGTTIAATAQIVG